MKKGIIIISMLLLFLLNCKGQSVTFSREKTLRLLQNLDSLVLLYEQYSSMNEIKADTDITDLKLLSLFRDTNSIIFDDINPNLMPRRIDWIVERENSVSHYLTDIKKTFSMLDCRITWTDLGNAPDRVFRDSNQFFVPVHITKDYKGYTNDSSLSAGFATHSTLKLLIRISDTTDFSLKIDSIRKTGLNSTEWQYFPPPVRLRKVQTLFGVTPFYSYLYKDDIAPEDIFNRSMQGGYGVSGEFLFNFILKNRRYGTTGIALGLGGTWANSGYVKGFYSASKEGIDMDGDNYNRLTDADNLSEYWQFYSGDFPLYLNFEGWRKKNLNKGRYFRIGGKLSYNFPARYHVSADRYSQSGYYPKYNVTISEVPSYGFVNEEPLNNTGTAKINPFNYSADLSFGKLRRSRNHGTIFYFGIHLSANINNILLADEPSMPYSDFYKSVLYTFKSGRLCYAGLTFGIRHANKNEVYLRPKKVKYLDKYSP